MRIELSPEKGALGRLGVALEKVGGSVITIDLQDIDARRAVDDVVVKFVDVHPTPELVVDTLTEFNAGKLRHWAPVDEAIDPVLRSIRWATSIFSAGADFADDEATRVIGEICGTTDAWLIPANDPRDLPIVVEAREKHAAVSYEVDRVPTELLGASFAGVGCLLAVPDSSLAPDKVAIVARPAGQTFSATEIERLSAILGVYRQAKMMVSTPRESTLPGSGPWFDVSHVR